ncbi:MAG: hypothetical protein Q4E13_08415 [Clostridia bacterium]|nr:hypothetical protein [Clostridia bacterium]
MAVSDAHAKASRKYESEKRCKLTIDMSPAQRAQINDFCKDKGGTGTFLKKLIRDEMRRAGIRPLGPDEEYQPEESAK